MEHYRQIRPVILLSLGATLGEKGAQATSLSLNISLYFLYICLQFPAFITLLNSEDQGTMARECKSKRLMHL